MDANPFGFIFALLRKAFSMFREDENSSSLNVLFEDLLRSFFKGVTQFATQIERHISIIVIKCCQYPPFRYI